MKWIITLFCCHFLFSPADFVRKGDGENAESDELVTKDMFYRDMLADPNQTGRVKRKKKNGSRYRTLDNRDNLPFLVKVTTPDPYTNNEDMMRKARKNTIRDKKKQKKKNMKNSGEKKKVRRNLIGMDGKDSIASSIYTRHNDGTLHQVIGEFTLDKSTNCGDIIQVGDNGKEYEVQKSKFSKTGCGKPNCS